MRGRRGILLEQLRAGPLHSDDWALVGSSRKSLHVRICRMREQGFTIDATASRREPADPRRNPPVLYTLRAEPGEADSAERIAA